jgi:hypothetical protein
MIGEEQISIHSKTRKVAGEVILTDIETGKETHFATAQCVHCQVHWVVQPGSGKRRGYCLYCKGMLCGADECIKSCVPFEAQLEYTEAVAVNNQRIVNKLFSRYPDIKIL